MAKRVHEGSAVEWFKLRPEAIIERISRRPWMEGLLFVTLYLKVHENLGPISGDVRVIAKATKLARRDVEKHLATLVEAGTVAVLDDGRLDVPMTRDEIAWRYTLAARHLNGPPDDFRSAPPHWQATRKRIFARDGYACAYCGTLKGPFEIDHIVAYARGGGHGDENLCVACKPCNNGKSDRSAQEWMQILHARTAARCGTLIEGRR